MRSNTILEIASEGAKQYVTSNGDTLTSLVRKIYQSYDDVYFEVLKKLNLRLDWENIPAGYVIKYLPKHLTSQIDEI